MLSHGSNASARLHRAKSSSSTRPRHPTSSESSTAYVEEAHYEALAAASHAFGQAHERVSLLQNTQHHLHCHSESSETMEDGGLQLGRQRSVRFSGPTAVTANARSITRRQPPAELNPKIYSQARKPPCRNDQVQSIEDYVTALPEAEESDIVTVQSSYRKLKKSKSLWSITKTSQWPFQSSNHDNRRRRSLDPSFSRSLSSTSQKREKYAESDAAVRLARDQFAQEVKQQRLRKKPSILSLKKRRNSAKAFRTTMRSSSLDSDRNELTTSLSKMLASGSGITVGQRARSMSTTIKSKLKRVFHGPPSPSVDVPTQQLDATRAHFRDYLQNPDTRLQDHSVTPIPNADPFSRIGLRNWPARTESAPPDQPSHPISTHNIHNYESLVDSNSRVTSWANSTHAESIAPHHAVEKKRLSVIQEHGGPHQPSSSIFMHGVSRPVFSAFCEPPRDQSAFNDIVGSPESQRMCSALQRRLQENHDINLACYSDGDKFDETLMPIGTIPQPPARRSSSMGTQILLNSWASENERRSREHVLSPIGSQESSLIVFEEPQPASDNGILRSGNAAFEAERAAFTQSISPNAAVGSLRDKGSSERHTKRLLRDVRSTFFPPNTHIERHSTSPYRRAMLKNDNQSASDVSADQGSPPVFLGVPDRVLGAQSPSAVESGSIYSRSADDDEPRQSPQSCSEHSTTAKSEVGTAKIFGDQSSTKSKSAGHARGQSSSSAKSSGDWKVWMATEVATLDHYPPTAEKKPGRVSGHMKEEAQVNSDDEVGVGKLESESKIARRCMGTSTSRALHGSCTEPLSSSTLGRSPISDRRQAHHMNEVTPVRSGRTIHPIQRLSSGQDENAPPQHVLKSDGTTPTKPPYYSLSCHSLSPAIGTRHKSTHPTATLSEQQETSSLNRRHEEPDSKRIRRLRRIKSSRSTISHSISDAHQQADTAAMERGPRRTVITEPEVVAKPDLKGSPNMIDYILGRVRRNVSAASKEAGDAAFL